MAVGGAGARCRSARARDDLVAGFGVDARPPVLGRPHAGPAVGCLLAGLATGHPAPLLRVLDARPIRGLGSSSYSLYLTHGPIVVVVCEKVVAGRVHGGVPAFIVSLALVVPLTILFARVFASVFERRFHPADSGTSSVCAPRRAFVTR